MAILDNLRLRLLAADCLIRAFDTVDLEDRDLLKRRARAIAVRADEQMERDEARSPRFQ